MATGSLASVSMECGPGSVTGCSAVNNDLVVCAAQECCNVWEYSTQSRRARGRERGETQKPEPSLSQGKTDKFPLSLLLSHYKKKNNIIGLGELAVREELRQLIRIYELGRLRSVRV